MGQASNRYAVSQYASNFDEEAWFKHGGFVTSHIDAEKAVLEYARERPCADGIKFVKNLDTGEIHKFSVWTQIQRTCHAHEVLQGEVRD